LGGLNAPQGNRHLVGPGFGRSGGQYLAVRRESQSIVMLEASAGEGAALPSGFRIPERIRLSPRFGLYERRGYGQGATIGRQTGFSPFEQGEVEGLAQLASGHVPTTDPIAIAGRDEGATVRGENGTVNFVVMTAQHGNLLSRRGVPKAHGVVPA